MKKLVAELSELVKKMPIGYQNELNFGSIDAGNDGIFPFSKIEKSLIFLIDSGIINIGQYLDIRKRYEERNKYLPAFQINSSKYFNQWIREYLKKEEPELIDASLEYDENYSQYHYQLLLDKKIRICVKASRAIERFTRFPIEYRALEYNDRTSAFRIQFQTFFFRKEMVDVYLLLGIWKDRIVNYLMTEKEIVNHPAWLAFRKSNAQGDGQLRIMQGDDLPVTYGGRQKFTEKCQCPREAFDPFIVPNNHLASAIRYKMRQIQEGKL